MKRVCFIISAAVLICTFLGDFAFSKDNESSYNTFFVTSRRCNATAINDSDQSIRLNASNSYPFVSNDDNGENAIIKINEKNYIVRNRCGKVVIFNKFFMNNPPKGTNILPINNIIPNINHFDREVVKICGEWGSVVNKASFLYLLRNNDAVFNDIYLALDKSLNKSGKIQEKEEFKNALADIWSNNNAFTHIFCGEPYQYLDNWNNNRNWHHQTNWNPRRNIIRILGGLHFIPRYLEMQNKGYIGLDKSCDSNSISDYENTVGVRYVGPVGNILSKCPNGYPIKMNAKSIIIYATKIIKNNDVSGNENQCCKVGYNNNNNANIKYPAVVCGSNNALRTFYTINNPDENSNHKCNL